jgi:MYXO-CTERM domain-containing protein
VLFTPSAKSGCNIAAADPTKPIPWFVGTGMLGLVLAFRSRRSRWGTR